jgi:Flp pilus assembly protein TadG
MWKHRQKPESGRKRSGKGVRRRGAAVAEFAVCLPLLITIVLGSIEASRLIHIQHGLETAAYEAARSVADHRASTSSDVDSVVSSILDAYQVTGGQAALTPSTLNTVRTGDLITVTVTAPLAGNRVISGWIPSWILTDGSLSAQCTALRG